MTRQSSRLRNAGWLAGLLLLVLSRGVGAQDAPQGHSATTPIAPEPIQGVEELYTTSSTQMLAASVSAKKDGATVRASFVPAEAFDHRYTLLMSEAKFTLFSDSSTSLTRVTVSTGYNPFNMRGEQANSVQRESLAKYPCGQGPVEQLKTCNRKRLSWQWSRLRNTWIPAITASFAVDVYPVGKVQDKVDPTKTAEAEPFGGFGPQLNLTFMPQERWQLDLWGSFRRARASGDPGSELAYYVGGGVTVSALAWSFFDWERLAQTADYYHDGFIPGVAMGVSGQGSVCDGEADCAKGRTRQASATPFVDVRVKPAVQLRLSAPIVWYKSVNASGTDLAPVLTLSGFVDVL